MAAYSVERVEASAVLDRLHAILEATRQAKLPRGLLEWRYLRNPAGPAATWVLRAPGGAIAGFTVCLPRRWWAAGRTWRAWVGADFSILPRYRTLGLALQLRRAARQAIDAGEADLLYSFPNEKMETIHAKAGHVRLGVLTRLARPVSAGPYLHRFLRPAALAAAAAPVADALMGVLVNRRPRARGLEVRSAPTVTFDERFDALFTAAAARHGPLGMRDARYLAWRFGAEPDATHGLLTASRGAELAGYAIFTERADLLHLRDALADAPENYYDLALALVAEARRRRLAGVSATLVAGTALARTLEDAGYRARLERAAVYGYLPSGLAWPADAAQWHMTVGDRDI